MALYQTFRQFLVLLLANALRAAIVGLHVQQTHDRDLLPRECCFLV
jgi:hypothetical protein